MQINLEGIGLLAPGLNGWEESHKILAGSAHYESILFPVPAATLLPANERRRAPELVRVAVAVGLEAIAAAGREPTDLPTIFASSGGEGNTIHEIMCSLASPEPALSPTRFHNSVHNVCAGYWSIATGSRAPTTSLCAHDGSFAAGLLEAAAEAHATGVALLIAYDMPYPAPLGDIRPIGAPFFGVGLVVTKAPSHRSLACLSIEPGIVQGATVAKDPGLDNLRSHTPAARGLPLLCAVVERKAQTVILEYLPGYSLPVSVSFGQQGE